MLKKYYDIITHIFEKSGYDVKTGKEIGNALADIVAMNEKVTYQIEVKVVGKEIVDSLNFYQNTIARIIRSAKENYMIPVIIFFACIQENERIIYKEKYPELIILDISNLKDAVKNTSYEEELLALLSFSVDSIETCEGEIPLGWMEHSSIARDLISELDNIKAGHDCFRKFEDACTDALKYLFSEDLALWENQKNSNKSLYRFDLVCRIKDNIYKSFWMIAEKYYSSKYVIFEFKNYNEKITQKEIYSTERYLYSKALRNLAIIIAKNGFDDNSVWAIKGSLRENGKLIIPITVDDLKIMLQAKENQNDPSMLLLEKLDGILCELEK